jgi:hypothetical protein
MQVTVIEDEKTTGAASLADEEPATLPQQLPDQHTDVQPRAEMPPEKLVQQKKRKNPKGTELET